VDPVQLADEIGADLDPRVTASFVPRYNFAPTQPSVIVVPGERRPLLEAAVWGWRRAGAPSKRRPNPPEKLVINAQAEHAAKNMFRTAMRERRGVLPVTGFYEWTGPPRDRRPLHFTAADGRALLLAVLWTQ